MNIDGISPFSHKGVQQQDKTPHEPIKGKIALEELVGQLQEVVEQEGVEKGSAKAQQLVETCVDRKTIQERAQEIEQQLQEAEIISFSDKEEWTQRIQEFVPQLKGKEERKEAIKKFIKLVEADFEKRMAQVKALPDGPEKTSLIEHEIIRYTTIGTLLAEKIDAQDPKLMRTVGRAFSSSKVKCTPILSGLKAFVCQRRAEKIKELESEVERLNTVLTKGVAGNERTKIEKAIKKHENRISILKKGNAKDIHRVVSYVVNSIFSASDQSLTVASEFISHIPAETLSTVATLGTAFSSSGLLVGSLSLGINGYLAYRNSAQLLMLGENIKSLEKEVKEVKNPEQALILNAKLDHLKMLRRELRIKLSQKAVGLTVGGLAVASSIGVILEAAGVTLSAATAISLGTMGIGAVVLGVGATIGGLSYVGYKNRHQIRYAAGIWDVTPRIHFNEFQLRRQLAVFSAASERITELEKTYQEFKLSFSAAKTRKESFEGRAEQALAARQISVIGKEARPVFAKLSEARKTASVASRKIGQLRETGSKLSSRKKDAQYRLKWRKTLQKFSKYDAQTIRSVESSLQGALKEQAAQNMMRDLLRSHGFDVIEPVTFEQILGFIIEDKKVTKERLLAA